MNAKQWYQRRVHGIFICIDLFIFPSLSRETLDCNDPGSTMQGNTTSSSSIDTSKRYCFKLPPKITSLGLLDADGSFEDGIMSYSMPQLELQIILIFFLTELSHFVLKRFGVPKLVSDILAGILMGPSLIGRSEKFRDIVFPIESQESLATLVTLGYSLFLFLIGVKMDLGMIRSSGSKAWTIGICSMAVPLLANVLLVPILTPGVRNEKEYRPNSLMFLGGILSLTPFPVIASLLVSLNMLSSELGRLVLSSAIVGDVLSSVVLFLFSLIRSGIQSYKNIIFLLGVIYVLRPAMMWVVRRTPKGKPINELYVYATILMIFGSGLLSVKWLDKSFIFGPYILGLAVPHGPPFGSALVEKLDYFASDFLLPFFLAICGLRADLSAITFDSKLVVITGVFFVITSISKLMASLVPCLYDNMPLEDALVVSILMSCKGIVDLASFSFLKDAGLVSDGSFALLIVCLLVVASIVPALVKYLYDPSRKYAGYQARDIAHLKPKADLKFLACIHIPENVTSVLNFFSLCSPTKDTPISVHIFHLIRLTGQASPVFVSHQIQKKIVSNFQYSENVILPFTRYEQNNPESVVVNAYTSITPLSSMHDDICTLALDQLASLIVLPFHRQWYINGSIESDDKSIRKLNCNVLETPPCSIGILINHCKLGASVSDESSHSYHVVIFFIGGGDDREALSLAKRIATDPRTFLTVVHFAVTEEKGIDKWETMLDSELLKEFKHENIGNGNVVYIEKIVKDGSETSTIMKSMVSEYDLVLVGRQHNHNAVQIAGLAEWCEFNELGDVGDLLASPDFGCNGYVLVVQHQKMKIS